MKRYIKLSEKDIAFDFIYLFMALVLFSSIFLILTFIAYKKPLFDDEDLTFLSLGKLAMYILVIPFIEEFAIRGIFALNKKINIVLFSISLAIIVLTFISQIWISSTIIITTLLFSGFLFFNLEFRNIINIFIKDYFIYLLCITSIIFGVLHLNNYETFDSLTFLKIIPRILGGFYLGYIAYKYGIAYSYLMHGTNNLLPFIFVFVYKILLYK